MKSESTKKAIPLSRRHKTSSKTSPKSSPTSKTTKKSARGTSNPPKSTTKGHVRSDSAPSSSPVKRRAIESRRTELSSRLAREQEAAGKFDRWILGKDADKVPRGSVLLSISARERKARQLLGQPSPPESSSRPSPKRSSPKLRSSSVRGRKWAPGEGREFLEDLLGVARPLTTRAVSPPATPSTHSRSSSKARKSSSKKPLKPSKKPSSSKKSSKTKPCPKTPASSTAFESESAPSPIPKAVSDQVVMPMSSPGWPMDRDDVIHEALEAQRRRVVHPHVKSIQQQPMVVRMAPGEAFPPNASDEQGDAGEESVEENRVLEEEKVEKIDFVEEDNKRKHPEKMDFVEEDDKRKHPEKIDFVEEDDKRKHPEKMDFVEEDDKRKHPEKMDFVEEDDKRKHPENMEEGDDKRQSSTEQVEEAKDDDDQRPLLEEEEDFVGSKSQKEYFMERKSQKVEEDGDDDFVGKRHPQKIEEKDDDFVGRKSQKEYFMGRKSHPEKEFFVTSKSSKPRGIPIQSARRRELGLSSMDDGRRVSRGIANALEREVLEEEEDGMLQKEVEEVLRRREMELRRVRIVAMAEAERRKEEAEIEKVNARAAVKASKMAMQRERDRSERMRDALREELGEKLARERLKRLQAQLEVEEAVKRNGDVQLRVDRTVQVQLEQLEQHLVRETKLRKRIQAKYNRAGSKIDALERCFAVAVDATAQARKRAQLLAKKVKRTAHVRKRIAKANRITIAARAEAQRLRKLVYGVGVDPTIRNPYSKPFSHSKPWSPPGYTLKKRSKLQRSTSAKFLPKRIVDILASHDPDDPIDAQLDVDAAELLRNVQALRKRYKSKKSNT